MHAFECISMCLDNCCLIQRALCGHFYFVECVHLKNIMSNNKFFLYKQVKTWIWRFLTLLSKLSMLLFHSGSNSLWTRCSKESCWEFWIVSYKGSISVQWFLPWSWCILSPDSWIWAWCFYRLESFRWIV